MLAGGSGRFFMNRGQLICSTKTIFPRGPKFNRGNFLLVPSAHLVGSKDDVYQGKRSLGTLVFV